MTKYFNKLAEMSKEERSKYFRRIGKKGGLASKSKGTNYSKLGQKGGKASRKALSPTRLAKRATLG